MITPTNASAVQSGIHSSVHALRARIGNHFSATIVYSQLPWAHGSIFSLSLVGLHMWPAAHLLYLLHSEFWCR